jgi:hypothetical protein
LHRYGEVGAAFFSGDCRSSSANFFEVGLCTLNKVDP